MKKQTIPEDEGDRGLREFIKSMPGSGLTGRQKNSGIGMNIAIVVRELGAATGRFNQWTTGVYIVTPSKAIAPPFGTMIERTTRPALVGSTELRGEIVRKSLHMLIALVPGIATVTGVLPALGMLGLGVLAYTGAEYYRLQGGSVAVVSALTVIASRPRDRGRFVVGPVTLGIGTMLALLLYPAPAAFLAIYALAFGDGVASLVGRTFGTIRITRGTTLEGSLACLVAVFAAATALTGDATVSLTIAIAATILEALPTDDMDNIILPVGVGLLATLLLAA